MARCFRLKGKMMRRVDVLSWVATAGLLPGLLAAQGTKLWSVDRYEEFEKGSAVGVAIRNDGRLEAGPATSLLYATGGNYLWSIAADKAGNAYLGLGGSVAGSAALVRIAKDGRATKMFEGKELAAQVVRMAGDGSVLVGTSPDGKVYRVAAEAGTSAAAVVFDPANTEEKPKYLWDVAVGKGEEIYVATGAPAMVYRVPAGGGKAEVLFRTGDQHIRCLLLGPDGTLWAGSDGAGVIYKVAATGGKIAAGTKAFAMYAASRKEITALTMDAAGNVYAAGVGAKGTAGLPPLPVTGAVGVTITISQPGSTTAAGSNALVPEGSEIYRIGVDGAPSKLVTLKDDVVYGLAVRNGSLLAASGNRGRVYRVDMNVAGRFTDLAHLEASQAMAFAAVAEGVIVATSNSGKAFRLSDATAKDATYTSEVFDAQGYSQWGQMEIRPDGLQVLELYVRSGNVPNTVIGWSEWIPVTKEVGIAAPAARFIQWKCVLREGRSVDELAVNYLPKNLAPVVDDIVVQAGARMAPAPQSGTTTIPVSFPVTSAVPVFTVDANASPLMAQRDKTAVTVRWIARDENSDDLMFAVWYRGVGERNWRLLKDKISDRYFSFDSALLPDGSYELKVVASDTPVHSDAETLTGERVSAAFVMDTTAPVPGVLMAEMVAPAGSTSAARIHVKFEAKDATSPIFHAEYSVDAGPWQYVEPVGKLSDSLEERYDFIAGAPTVTVPVIDVREHVIAMRVYDRFENVVTVKAVVR